MTQILFEYVEVKQIKKIPQDMTLWKTQPAQSLEAAGKSSLISLLLRFYDLKDRHHNVCGSGLGKQNTRL